MKDYVAGDLQQDCKNALCEKIGDEEKQSKPTLLQTLTGKEDQRVEVVVWNNGGKLKN